MYNVMIVDDDVAVLTFLTKMIPWDQYGLTVTGTFTNAHSAIEACKESMPDLMLTDIGMPGMNGIELIRSLHAEPEHPRFLILSCHDEFQYAQQAMQLGVQDYILKETLSVEVIQDILGRICQLIEKDHRLRRAVEKLHQQAKQSKSGLKEKWLRDLLTTPLIDQKSWNEQLREYGLNPDLGCLTPVVCRIYRFQDALERYHSENVLRFIIDNAIEELLQQESDVVYFPYSAKEFCLLFACRRDLKLNPYEWIERVSKHLQRSLARVLKIELSVVIGDVDENMVGIKRQWLHLLQLTEGLFYATAPVITRSNQILPLNNQEELLPYYSEYSERINRLVLEQSSDIQPIVSDLIERIRSRRFHPATVKPFLFRLTMDIQMKLTFSHQYHNEKVQRMLDQIDHVSELEEWLTTFLQEAVGLMEQISRNSKKVEILDAQKYIQLHLDQKITLEEVAEHLYLNSSYFSRLFKKEMGENFVEYVTRMKMEKARELLNETDHTIDTIAQMLGYDNKSYFVKLFKKHYGAPPSRFV